MNAASPTTALVPSASDLRRARIGLAVVIVSTFFLGLAHGIGYPLTALQFEAWGAPAWVSGLAAGMPALAALILLPVAPRIAARFGFVPTMVVGAVLGGAGFALMPVLDGVGAWLALRFLMGLGLVFPWLLGETWINTVSTDATRGRVLALYVLALFGGYGAGPLLLVALPDGGLAAFAIGIGALALCAVPLLAAARLAPAMDSHGGTASLGALWRMAPVAALAALLGGVVEYAYLSLLPAFGLRQGLAEADALRLVTAFLWGGVALSFLFGWLADRMPRERLMRGLAIAFLVVAVPTAALVEQPMAALVGTVVLGGVACAFYMLGLAILGDRASPAELASANAAYLMLYQLGTLGGPPLAGAAMDLVGPWGLVWTMLLFVAAAWAWMNARRSPAD